MMDDYEDREALNALPPPGSRWKPASRSARPAVKPIREGQLSVPVALYEPDAIRAALGLEPDDDDWPAKPEYRGETEHQCRLAALLKKGEHGRWRRAVGPRRGAIAAIDDLEAKAPHLAALTGLLRKNARASLFMGVPMFLGATVLVGEPGMGKTWLLSRIARALGLPFRSHSMNLSSLSEGLSGSHPSWRNSSPGVVAQALLREEVANPVISVDELDKAAVGNHNTDPFRPFYTLLDPAGARVHVDEFLGFPVDASRILWIAAANDLSPIPRPILDRLRVIEVPPMTREHRRIVAQSAFAEQNEQRGGFFAPLNEAVCERLAGLHPRAMRIAIEDAMAEAASVGRRELAADDVRPRTLLTQERIGFRFGTTGRDIGRQE